MPDADRLKNGHTRKRLSPKGAQSGRLSGTMTLIAPTVSCPECGARLLEVDEPNHLTTVHGYVQFAGALLPRAAALRCLWDRVFSTGDPQANERLCSLLQSDQVEHAARSAYATALEVELVHRLNTPHPQRRQEIERWVKNLRKSASVKQHFWDLLRSSELRVRQLGRELLLPEVGFNLSSIETTPAEVRRWLDQLCPEEDIWQKLFVCQRLPHFGADRTAVKYCLRQLQQQRPIACPECAAVIPGDELNEHLRGVHRIYQFRGRTQPLPDLLATLFSMVCAVPADTEAWKTLEALAGEVHGVEADSVLAGQLVETLGKLRANQRGPIMRAAAEVIADSEHGSGVALELSRSEERYGRCLALLIGTLLPTPLPRPLVRALRPLLARKRAPGELQITAAAALMRTTGTEGHAAENIVNALLQRCGKNRAADRLRQLEEQIGPSTLLTERCTEIENQIRMSCPRCQVQLRRPDMALHLWTEHELLLDGRRVRTPWRMIKDWVKSYRRTGKAELLAQCRALGQHLDPENGVRIVHRLILAYGVEDVEARQILLAEARLRRVALCPRCYGFVPAPVDLTPRPLNVSHGRLSLGSYCVHVYERGFAPHLHVETPSQIVYDGREPDQWLTHRVAVLAIAGPLVVAALVLAFLLRKEEVFAVWQVLACLAAAAAAYVGIQVHAWLQPRPLARAIDHAWLWLVPQLHAGSFSPDDALFITGLAMISPGHGNADVRAPGLQRTIRLTENAVADGSAGLVHLTALRSLEIADLARSGQDPLRGLVKIVGQCFHGRPPLIFAQQLLSTWQDSPWVVEDLARLRILLCDQAFEAGREVNELLQAGQLAPAMGKILEIEAPERLAQLRLLWSLRPLRPWHRWSSAMTIFELTSNAEMGRELLRRYPDLLLVEDTTDPILICGRGVLFRQVLFAHPPSRVESKARRDFDGVDYHVIVGEHHFTFADDPTPRIKVLERWLRYFFDEFRPQVAQVLAWPTPVGTRPLRFQEAVQCPECRHALVPVSGGVGLSLEANGSPNGSWEPE
jgi:hypothetical protein